MELSNDSRKTTGNFAGPMLLSTSQVPQRDRRAWLIEEIGRRYANVEIIVPGSAALFNEMRIFPLGNKSLSIVRSNAIQLHRPGGIPGYLETDAVFFVMLLRGSYRLEQDTRSVELRPGNITLYDVRRPHSIDCRAQFSKLIFKVPGDAVRARIPLVERLTARRIPTNAGAGAVAASCLRGLLHNAPEMTTQEAARLGDCMLDLLAVAVGAGSDSASGTGGKRYASLRKLQASVETHLHDGGLDAPRFAAMAGMSVRYANELLAGEGTSLMRYVWERRLERARETLSASPQITIAELASRWGFKSAAHFSRAFSARFGRAPSACYGSIVRPRSSRN